MVICLYLGLPQCRWANEECSVNQDCCSKHCVLKNPGTHHRCKQSFIGQYCLYRYHCEERLMCGSNKKCCASYWDPCSNDTHCCDPEHKCLPADGFIYKVCLYRSPNGAQTLYHSPWWRTLTLYDFLILGFIYAR
jgi:hypothetical protein